MDFSQMKKFIPKKGEKYIFIENGEPAMVLISFEDYQEKFNGVNPETEDDFQIRQTTIDPLIEQTIKQNQGNFESEAQSQELKLEDLPF